MGLLNFREPKKAAAPETQIICDLDSVVEKRAAFTLEGVTHYVNPVTTQNFVIWVTKLAELKKEMDAESVKQKYFEMINFMCPTVTMKMINKLTQAQCVMLFAAICDKVMGKQPEAEKKSP